jgi:signal transduction histidine kinase
MFKRTSTHIDRLGLSSRLRVLLILLALIGAAALATWFFQIQALDRTENRTTELQREAVAEALQKIEDAFDEMHDSMYREGQSLARDDRVIRSLRLLRSGDESGKEGLARIMSSYPLREYRAIELYDPQPRLVGWSGASMPMDNAPASSAFLDRPQTGIATDGGIYSALVVWMPVLDGVETIGAVRVLRMIVEHVPVRNKYLRDYTLDEEWSRLTGLPVTVDLMSSDDQSESGGSWSEVLTGLDGNPVARVAVTPPEADALAARVTTLYTDILFFWLTLAIGLILGWLWRWNLSSYREDSDVGSLMRFLSFLVMTVSARYILIWAEVPARWQRGKSPLAPLFDPQHLASGYGFGILATTGDLLLTAAFAVMVILLLVRITEPLRRTILSRTDVPDRANSVVTALGSVGVFALHSVIAFLTLSFLSHIVHNAVLDSTLDYFERANLLPQRLVLLVLIALLLLSFAAIFFSARMFWISVRIMHPASYRPRLTVWTVLVGLLTISVTGAVFFFVTDLRSVISIPATAIFIASVYMVALASPMKSDRISDWLRVRTVVPSIVLFALLLYPILEHGLDTERHIRMQLAAKSFDDDMDSRVTFVLGQILDRASEPEFARAFREAETGGAERLDSLAQVVTTDHVAASLGSHELTLTIFSESGEPSGRYVESTRPWSRSILDNLDRDEYDLLHDMYKEQGDTGVLIEKMTGRRERERFVYEGFAPILDAGRRTGWLLIRAEPVAEAREGIAPFPRVLVPSGEFVDNFENLSLAEFRDDVLIRSFGRNFGRYTLDPSVSEALLERGELWRTERVRDRDFVTFYRYSQSSSPSIMDARPTIIAVRVPAINFFDHLFYLLRVTVAGLLLGIPIYLLGLFWRFHKGLVPARRVQFRDKVLNAFFVVGTVTVAAMGWVGLRVVTGENDRAVESWLRQHLERVEDTLNSEAQSDELAYGVLERVDLDSLSERVGLDLNVYRGVDLSRSTRPNLIRERLIDSRLPVKAYEALFFDGFRFITVEQKLGSFTYTAGYRALVDEEGKPRYVISLPTLPEQERIEEERARTVAYLFGALLLLVMVVMVTAAALANALARPMARLRSGLQAVAEGRFESIGPVRSRDEISDLVRTFNAMQDQLVESRTLLAQQERQLAWREMARQVAHEIKNPLTPMKLSIQHLRSAFRRSGSTEENKEGKSFSGIFGRTTSTLIEQIDALARIADEFASFGRMPRHVQEPVDLNAVVEEAVSLMANQSEVQIRMALTERTPIVNGDREALRRMFINLIKNAAQSVPEDRKGMIRLTTEWDKQQELIVVRVIDNGTGIDPRLWNKIFVPSFSTKTSGTGLGLALAQKTIDDMKGEIGFDTSNSGTTFWIRLHAAEH